MMRDIYGITGLIILVFIVLVMMEKLRPLRKATRPWLPRFLLNISLSVPMFMVAAFLVRPVGVFTMQQTTRSSFGILHWLALPSWALFLIGFLLMDLSFYYWHWLNHRWPLLWRFHNAHHIDPDLDVSTAIRFHWMEVGYSTLFRFIQLGIIGISPLTFLIYETVFQLNTLFHHSNLKLPIRFERLLNKILVTPRMHGIHHSQIREELNSNFSVVFPWWDHLHRTIRLNISQPTVKIGVPAYEEINDNRFWRVMNMPFLKQRNYWPADFRKRISSADSKDPTFLLE